VQFFFEDTAPHGFNIYVLDEANQVEVYQKLVGEKDELIASVNSFYTSVKDERSISSKLINFNLPQYYDVIHPDNGDSYIVPYRNDSGYKRPQKVASA
jgi:adenylate cyclase class 1